MTRSIASRIAAGKGTRREAPSERPQTVQKEAPSAPQQPRKRPAGVVIAEPDATRRRVGREDRPATSPSEEVAIARREKAPVWAPARDRSDRTFLGYDPQRLVVAEALGNRLPKSTLDYLRSRSPGTTDFSRLPAHLLSASEAPSRAWTGEMERWAQNSGGVDNNCIGTVYLARALSFFLRSNAQYNEDQAALIEARENNDNLVEAAKVMEGLKDKAEAAATELRKQNAELEDKVARYAANYDKVVADFTASHQRLRSESAAHAQLREEVETRVAAARDAGFKAGYKEFDEKVHIPSLDIAYVYAYVDAAANVLKVIPGFDLTPFRNEVAQYMKENNVNPDEVDLGILTAESSSTPAGPVRTDVEIIVSSPEPAVEQPPEQPEQPTPPTDLPPADPAPPESGPASST